MCGVVALFLKRPLTDADIALGRELTGDVAHRGPDAGGEWYDRANGVYFGHRRLSIVDLSDASNQPFVRDGFALSYNGEVYNFQNLRRLQESRGVPFETSGDVEVLLRLWQDHGPAAVEKIDGMFGFALWDGSDGWLAVDRYGEKQLYHAETPDGSVICSELGPLVRRLGLCPSLSAEMRAEFLALGYIAGPRTAYREVTRLPPATVVRLSLGAVCDRTTYWRPPFGKPTGGAAKPLTERELDRLQEALLASLDKRLYSDAPVCLFLSGGTDSSLIAAMAAHDLGRSLDCITVGFPQGATRDEVAAAALVAQHLGHRHHPVQSEGDPSLVNGEAILDYFGQPNDNVTITAVHQMAREATRLNYKVGITGMGGDEVFYGYNKHAHFYRYRHLYLLPEGVRRSLATVAAPWTGKSSKLDAFVSLFGVRDFELFLAFRNPKTLPALRGLEDFDAWALRSFARQQPIAYESIRFDLEDSMVNSRLPTLDIGSMRAGLELRTPYLSREVQDVIASFDPRSLLAFGQKSVLRRLLNRYLPKNLVDRPKHGFIFPLDRFLASTLRPPKPEGITAAWSEAVWSMRNEPAWHAMAIRLLLLDAFDGWRGRLINASSGAAGTSKIVSY
ncbi:MAG: asparagine synthase (glutamine-hydrolyzing) [Pseudorhodoplanes sp.]|nr:asparagine synthase (glutamine-hydrolyzing) [Pseudorhodoplanes sp.]